MEAVKPRRTWTYVTWGLVIAMILVASANSRRLLVQMAYLSGQAAEAERNQERSDMLINQLVTDKALLELERNELRNSVTRLENRPDRIVYRPCEDRPTPAFPDDSRTRGTKR